METEEMMKQKKCRHIWKRIGRKAQARLGHYELLRCKKCHETRKSYYKESVEDFLQEGIIDG